LSAHIPTPYQSQYIAWLLSRQIGRDSPDLLASTLVDARVDLNPHQVEAALFAFRSPLSQGVILADEVGLGKTIEAGLVIAQRWAERKRRILIITPANLRKQWHQELQDKFSLQALILEAKSYKEQRKAGLPNPFDQASDPTRSQASQIVICSYQFAKTKADDLRRVRWDLVVMDEAHRLRNVYKPGNVIGKTLKEALAHAPKVLLTATPLQNSLLELYGMVSLVDERVFGDLPSFREQFGALGNPDTLAKLRSRLQSVCMRTLRRQVQPYISYTRRIPMVEPFTPSAEEQALHDRVADYPQLLAKQHAVRVVLDVQEIQHAVRGEYHARCSPVGAFAVGRVFCWALPQQGYPGRQQQERRGRRGDGAQAAGRGECGRAHRNRDPREHAQGGVGRDQPLHHRAAASSQRTHAGGAVDRPWAAPAVWQAHGC